MEEGAFKIVLTLREAGFEAFLAGGCVRDMVMGIQPDDYDIATSARPQHIIESFEKTIAVGAHFGVVIVVLNGFEYEVATFRTDHFTLTAEGTAPDGRHPTSVTFTSAEEDVKRRDFTINGMLYDPILDQVIDLVGGQDDIKRRLTRTIGDPHQRFEEDKLRLMRAIRFAVRFEYELEAKTLEAVQDLADKISEVSQERIRGELLRIITGPNAGVGLQMLYDTGLLLHILPEVNAMADVEQPPNFHPEGDVFTHTKLMFDHAQRREEGNSTSGVSPELAMAALLHDVGKPVTFERSDRIRFNEHDKVGAEIAERICKRLRFSNEQIQRITSVVAQHMKFMWVRRMKTSTLKKLLRDPYIEDHLELHRLDCLASHSDLENWEFCKEKQSEFDAEEISPPPLIRGWDLIDMGFRPGPIFSEILGAVEDAQLEGQISTKEEAVEFVKGSFVPWSLSVGNDQPRMDTNTHE